MPTISLKTTSDNIPVFDSQGRLQFITDTEGLSKRIRDRLSLAKGSCIFDTAAGSDQSFLGSKLGVAVARRAISETILNTEGVRELKQLTLSLGANRQLNGTFIVKSSYGVINGVV